jgi:hypothetical protein
MIIGFYTRCSGGLFRIYHNNNFIKLEKYCQVLVYYTTNCPMKGQGESRCKVHGEFARIQALIMDHLREKPLAEIV